MVMSSQCYVNWGHLFVCLSVTLFVCLSVRLSVCLIVFIYVFVRYKLNTEQERVHSDMSGTEKIHVTPTTSTGNYVEEPCAENDNRNMTLFINIIMRSRLSAARRHAVIVRGGGGVY